MSLQLIKRPGRPCWYIHGTVRGISVRESTKTDNREAAEALRIKRENEILQRSIHGAATTATFDEAVISYLAHGGKNNTGGDETFLQKISDRIGATLLKDINQAFIDRLALAMYPKGQPSSRARAVYTPISAVLHHAAERGLCTVPRIKRPKAGKVRDRWLKPEEAERLIEACAPHLRPLVIFLFATGVRLSEAIYLDWRDVDLRAKHVNIVGRDDGTGRINTKNGDARGIPLVDRAAEALRELGERASGPVFLTNRGEAYAHRHGRSGGQVITAFTTACARAGIEDFTPHCCRHTWASWHYQANRDLQQLQRDGGWKSITMVLRYAHLNSEQARPSVAAALSHWETKTTAGKTEANLSSAMRKSAVISGETRSDLRTPEEHIRTKSAPRLRVIGES